MTIRDRLPRWTRRLNRAADRATRDLGGGPRVVPLNVVIDIQKALTGPLVLALMARYDAFTSATWVYFALHGGYGLAWVLKDLTFPDRRWRRRVTLASAMVAVVFLALYWVAPFVLTSGVAGPNWAPASAPWLAVAVALHTAGIVLMLGADLQKSRALREGGSLVTSGFFSRVRHPNYLGEMLVYGSYALIVNHWLPWAILGAIWLLYFVPNMVGIDASLSRYPGFEEWRSRTGLVLPKLWR